MKTAADKSQYEKLYLIQPEIYNRVVPKLNEVEKQELKDLNEKNSNSLGYCHFFPSVGAWGKSRTCGLPKKSDFFLSFAKNRLMR